MSGISRLLKYISWPVACGILLGLVVLQYQQLQQLGNQTLPVATYRLPPLAPPYHFSEAIALAAPAVVAINATNVNVESIERTSDDRLNSISRRASESRLWR